MKGGLLGSEGHDRPPARDTSQRLDMCYKLVEMRKAVGDSLGFGLCRNPVLDMLLDLYLARYERRATYLWPLHVAAHIPNSTAQRRLVEMEQDGLLFRDRADDDARRISVGLTARGCDLINALLDRMISICEGDRGKMHRADFW